MDITQDEVQTSGKFSSSSPVPAPITSTAQLIRTSSRCAPLARLCTYHVHILLQTLDLPLQLHNPYVQVLLQILDFSLQLRNPRVQRLNQRPCSPTPPIQIRDCSQTSHSIHCSAASHHALRNGLSPLFWNTHASYSLFVYFFKSEIRLKLDKNM